MDVDGERFLTILYVSNFAELPRSVFIRTQIQTAALSGNHRTISWATRGETAMTHERRWMTRIPTKLKPWF